MIYTHDILFSAGARFTLVLYMLVMAVLAGYQMAQQDWIWFTVDLVIIVGLAIWWKIEGNILNRKIEAIKKRQSDEALMGKVLSNRSQQMTRWRT